MPDFIVRELRNVCPGIEVTTSLSIHRDEIEFRMRHEGRLAVLSCSIKSLQLSGPAIFIDKLFEVAESWAPKKMAPVCNTRRISQLLRYGSKKNRGHYAST
jgi:hypothetical protein